MKTYCVYILASRRNGTLYVGVTNDIVRRLDQHRTHLAKGFTTRYEVKKLVHYELTGEISAALQREKQLKKWKREWKLQLIEDGNPEWRDLSEDF